MRFAPKLKYREAWPADTETQALLDEIRR